MCHSERDYRARKLRVLKICQKQTMIHTRVKATWKKQMISINKIIWESLNHKIKIFKLKGLWIFFIKNNNIFFRNIYIYIYIYILRKINHSWFVVKLRIHSKWYKINQYKVFNFFFKSIELIFLKLRENDTK
jgi:hypothetical protein